MASFGVTPPPFSPLTRRDSEHSCSSASVHKFCLTGGPCAGKTTALDCIREFLTEKGFRVFTVPEAATIIWLAGAQPGDQGADEEKWIEFQSRITRTQQHLGGGRAPCSAPGLGR